MASSRICVRQRDGFILDEPTFAFDAGTEFETLRQMLNDKVSKVAFLVFHRFLTVG
ncbi:MAG TPA: hypothetical protein PLL88_04695 [Anaerolineaceae bacterium]|nr:hypothetical protein [Anaerolineaceae bacterium]